MIKGPRIAQDLKRQIAAYYAIDLAEQIETCLVRIRTGNPQALSCLCVGQRTNGWHQESASNNLRHLLKCLRSLEVSEPRQKSSRRKR